MKALKYGSAGGVAAGLVAASGSASAALDANIATGLTSLQTDFNSLIGLVYPVMIGITVAMVIFGLVKGFIHRAGGK